MSTASGDSAFLRIDAVVKDFGDFRAVDQVSLDAEYLRIPLRRRLVADIGYLKAIGGSALTDDRIDVPAASVGFAGASVRKNTPTSGRIVLNGQDLAGLPPYRRPVNMMFQSYALFPHLTVADNVAYGLVNRRTPRAQATQRVTELLRLVGLPGETDEDLDPTAAQESWQEAQKIAERLEDAASANRARGELGIVAALLLMPLVGMPGSFVLLGALKGATALSYSLGWKGARSAL